MNTRKFLYFLGDVRKRFTAVRTWAESVHLQMGYYVRLRGGLCLNRFKRVYTCTHVHGKVWTMSMWLD